MKSYFPTIISIFGLCLALASCTKPPDFPIVPAIQYEGISKTTLDQGFLFEDTTYIFFSFTDGDGDLGDKDSLNIFLTDTRDGFTNKLRIPEIPAVGIENGIEGEVTLLLFTTCCIFPDNIQPPCTASNNYPTDELRYEIYIRDRAGNVSNTIVTDKITLRCN